VPIRSAAAPTAQPRAKTADAAPVRPGTAEFAAQQKNVKAAVEFMATLSPRPGFGYPVDDLRKLSPAARAVLDVFAGSRNYVEARATEFNGGSRRSEAGPELHPGKLPARLDAALKPLGDKGANAASILAAAAKKPGLTKLTRSMLEQTAAQWEGRAKSPAWKAAQALRPAGEAKAPAPLAGSASTKRYEAQASKEWDLAPQARGWGDRNRELRELTKSTDFPGDQPWGNDDIRAFTREEWLAWRVPQLKQAEENVRLPDWR
jgi:hypothetical protein